MPFFGGNSNLKLRGAITAMDYYQGVVADFLDADPAVFINNEYYIRLDGMPPKGNSWYSDIMAINMRDQAAYLCEMTFSKSLGSLIKRLEAWDARWPAICEAIRQKSSIPADWIIQPWLFIPENRKPALLARLNCTQMPQPRLTWLESVVPWNYNSDERTENWIESLNQLVRSQRSPDLCPECQGAGA